jgi:hypothetical protein
VPNDAYAAKVDRSGKRLRYATYIGGAGIEEPFDNGLDRRGNLYVTGNTTSSQTSFPDGDGFGAIPGFDRSFNGGSSETGGDAFVVKLARSGTRLAYATYIGGTGEEQAIGLDVDRKGSAYIAGNSSSRRRFPARGGLDRRYNGGPSDAFLAKLAPSGRRLAYAGYVGGTRADGGIGLAVDSAGSAYVVGDTGSARATFPVIRGPSRRFRGPRGTTNAFVAKIGSSGRR